jgi:hypothetical protein
MAAGVGFAQEDTLGVGNPLADAARAEGQSFADRARVLNDSIARGWSAGAVRNVMGNPEQVQRRLEGRDQIEIWGYNGFDVRVAFRNGLVETWFVRFVQ